MNPEDQAAETLLGYAGRRASRELLAAIIMAPHIFQCTQTTHWMHLAKDFDGYMTMALHIADTLMKKSAENPPKC